jgi:phosphoribosylaminoimidazole-succinocarboxamide synthase
VEKGAIIHAGKGKTLYETSDPDLCIMSFKDELFTHMGQKRETIPDKGICNAKISRVLFALLSEVGIPNHYLQQIGDRDLLVRKMEMLPVKFMVRNVVAGNLARLLGMEEGLQLLDPVLEYYYLNEKLGEPLVNASHLRILGIVDEGQLRICTILAQQVNLVLKNFFARRGILLVDCQLQFGKIGKEILLGDELTPDTCRLWDARTGVRLDKDRFRRELGGVTEAYQQVLARVLEKK